GRCGNLRSGRRRPGRYQARRRRDRQRGGHQGLVPLPELLHRRDLRGLHLPRRRGGWTHPGRRPRRGVEDEPLRGQKEPPHALEPQDHAGRRPGRGVLEGLRPQHPDPPHRLRPLGGLGRLHPHARTPARWLEVLGHDVRRHPRQGQRDGPRLRPGL
ncbi:MAG: hypothetical protein AVDCRST_MAG22-3046, partial [uncultured Rubrobacteraceae bacterium]